MKLLEVWFGSDLQIEMKLNEVENGVFNLKKTLSKRWLSMKGRVEAACVLRPRYLSLHAW